MSGAILLPLYAFMAWTGTTFCFLYNHVLLKISIGPLLDASNVGCTLYLPLSAVDLITLDLRPLKEAKKSCCHLRGSLHSVLFPFILLFVDKSGENEPVGIVSALGSRWL
jgi:hypothetical protein